MELEQILIRLLNGIYAIIVFLSIVMPKKMSEIVNNISIKKLELEMILDFSKFNNKKIAKPNVFFKRI